MPPCPLVPTLALPILLLLAAAPLPMVAAQGDALPDLVMVDVAITPGPHYVGDPIEMRATVRNDGAAAAGEANVFFLSGAFHEAVPVPALAPGESAEAVFVWTPEETFAGSASIIVNFDGRVYESDRANNRFDVDLLYVVPLPGDLQVRILGIERPTLRRDVGDAPHPLGVRRVVVELCNLGRGDLDEVWMQVLVQADTFRWEVLAQGPLGHGIASGACETRSLRWDPLGYVGDVTVTADASAYDELTYENNVDAVRDYVLVGGTGFGVGTI